jgi:RNA polymerase sigma-70 factor, ECF subfamily
MSEETFEALLAPQLEFVRTLVYTRVKATAHADDIVQEVLLRAFTHRNQLRAESKFKTWIWSIALNTIRQHFRRERGLVSLDEFATVDVRDRTASPLSRLEWLETRDWVRAGMARLSKSDQATIRLRDLEERSLPETAAALHRSESAAKTAHFRARKRLAKALRSIPRFQTCNSIRQAA